MAWNGNFWAGNWFESNWFNPAGGPTNDMSATLAGSSTLAATLAGLRRGGRRPRQPVIIWPVDHDEDAMLAVAAAFC
jgi:hypothetical protein